MLKKNVIRGVALDSKGYKIGMEILAKGNYERVKEIPYAFTDRKYGDSKLNFRIVGEYTSQLISLYFGLFGQFIKFCAVGGIGAAINLFALYFLVEFIHLWYIFGAAVAFVMAVSSNFILNKRWTFDDRRKGLWAIKSYVKFFVISIAGLAINLSVLYLLVEYFSAWYIFAQVVAIVAATIWNFTGSKKWAFK
jgi:dolichol-phosphate mannosyltransferase